MEIHFNQYKCHLKVHGSGPRLLICLHGYGNTGNLFDFIGERLPDGMRMLTLDLPGFGKSPLLHQGKSISSEDWLSLLNAIQKAFPDTKEMLLMGYSIGARIALHWFTYSDHQFSKVILLAPDGLRLHPLYRFCVRNPLGRFLFKQTLRHPGAFLFVLRILYNLKAIDKARYRFVRGKMEDEEERRRIENVWLGYARLEKSFPEIKAKTQEWNTSWHLIWGEKDRVIKPKWGQKFVKRVPGAQLNLLRGGHALLQAPSKKLKVMIDNLLKEK